MVDRKINLYVNTPQVKFPFPTDTPFHSPNTPVMHTYTPTLFLKLKKPTKFARTFLILKCWVDESDIRVEGLLVSHELLLNTDCVQNIPFLFWMLQQNVTYIHPNRRLLKICPNKPKNNVIGHNFAGV